MQWSTPIHQYQLQTAPWLRRQSDR